MTLCCCLVIFHDSKIKETQVSRTAKCMPIAYDQNGKFVMEVQMLCVENIEMETALSNNAKSHSLKILC